MIKRVWSTEPRFKSVSFSDGLNLVLAERSDGSTERQSRNSVGKSSLIAIIDFLLGATRKDELQIPNYESELFFGEFSVRGNTFVVGRNPFSTDTVLIQTDGPFKSLGTPTLDGYQQVPLKEWREAIGREWYGLSGEPGEPSYRSLVHFSVRPEPSAYLDPLRPTQGSAADVQTNNLWLLGLGWQACRRWHAAMARLTDLNQKEKELRVLGFDNKRQGVLFDEVVRLERESATLSRSLAEFDVLPSYEALSNESDQVARAMQILRRELQADRAVLARYEDNTSDVRDDDPDTVRQMYNAAGVEIPGVVLREIDQVMKFHRSIVENRRAFLRVELERLFRKIRENQEELQRLGRERERLMTMLKNQGALAEYSELQSKANQVQARLDFLRQRLNEVESVKTQKAVEKANVADAAASANLDLNANASLRAKAVGLYARYVDALYEEGGRLTIETTDRGYRIKPSVNRGSGEGTEHSNVFAYDLLLSTLQIEREIGPGFLLHDTTLYDSIEERQRAIALRLASSVCETTGLQYIAFFNSDDLPNEDLMGDIDLRLCTKLILLDTDDGGLFGFRFNLSDQV